MKNDCSKVHNHLEVLAERLDVGMQAVYHGFGVTVLPAQLAPVSKEPIYNAVSRVLSEPAFLVDCSCSSLSRTTMHSDACLQFLAKSCSLVH